MDRDMDTTMRATAFLDKTSGKTTSLPVSWSSGSLSYFTEEIGTYYFVD